MQAIRSRAAHLRTVLFPSDSLSRQGIPSLETIKPLYDRKPVWWTRWTYPLVCVNLIVTAYACELTWDHWTELEKPAKSKSKAGKPNDTKGDEDAEEPKYVLRPVWHRGTFAMGQMMLGVGLSALILGAASRQVRRLYVIPTPKALQTAQAATGSLAKKSLIVQTVHHLRDRGKVIPMSLCTLRRGRNEKEVIVVPEGFTGTFWVDLEKDAKMWGKEDMSLWHMKQAMYQAFYGQQWAKVLNKHGWVQ